MASHDPYKVCTDCFGIVGELTLAPPHEGLELISTTFFGLGISGREVNAIYRFRCQACGVDLMRDRNPAEREQVWLLGREAGVH
ncbi:hypothetical protein [Xylophilus sp. GOD-11R]|uniref:hypothetical protein n=1 Tax=Xylophilus sp. GOD-11R TaxID=3089814 RepID=UPI00298D1343|nr:hypothetical protein [Xylophilus sp. GOD-11R]WPB55183.1 hypothetical protein R9X41_13575 [Xylophilus sp. GOD-11R]